ncbi:MAG: hypothetical protein Q8N89_07850 [Azonexus sp.]|nr:hypothetical protein [Azonexus sp.]
MNLETDAAGKTVTALTWAKSPVAGTMVTHPGVYCLRPVFHAKEDRSDGLVRMQLKTAGIKDSWASLRQTLAVQRRLTASLRRKDGRTIHVRKSTLAEPALMKLYQALAINPAPGGTKKLSADDEITSKQSIQNTSTRQCNDY